MGPCADKKKCGKCNLEEAKVRKMGPKCAETPLPLPSLRCDPQGRATNCPQKVTSSAFVVHRMVRKMVLGKGGGLSKDKEWIKLFCLNMFIFSMLFIRQILAPFGQKASFNPIWTGGAESAP